MTDSDFQRIEEALELKLPEAYKQFMRSYPEDLRKGSLGLSVDREGPEDLYLVDDPAEVIRLNLAERELERAYFEPLPAPIILMGVQIAPEPFKRPRPYTWDDQSFAIGRDGTGGTYFLRLDDAQPQVLFYHVADDEVSVEGSLSEYATEIRQSYQSRCKDGRGT